MIRTASISLQGKRATNQDRVLVVRQDSRETAILAAVADGLGGMLAGDKAAQIAVDTFEEYAVALMDHLSGSFADACRFSAGICQLANDRIGDWAEKHESPGAVGTTLVALIVSGPRFLVINIGDSRCYRVGAAAQQMTQDHTVAETLLRQGALTLEDYDSSPLRNQLIRSLGPKPIAEPDFFPNSGFGTMDTGDMFVLCSDGFYSKLKNPDFIKLLDRSSDLEGILKNLAAEALNRDSTDNISAVVVHTEPES